MEEKKTHILGCKVDLISEKEVDLLLDSWLEKRQGKVRHIVTLNPEIATKGDEDHSYRSILNNADLTIVDGFGLKIGAKILGTKLPKRMVGRKLMDKLCRLSVKKRSTVYLLGAKEGVANRARQKLEKMYPDIQIVGAESGHQASEFKYEDIELINRINKSKAEIVFVAFGAPKQEKWIAKNSQYLDKVKVAVGIGGLLDYLAGDVPTPPKFIQSIGLEWLYRLFTQKGRVRRILNATIGFPLACLKWKHRMSSVYRKNVLGVIRNRKGEILLVSPSWSIDTKWQFPQGGVDDGETEMHAIRREMYEELGVKDLKIVAHHKSAYKYTWPKWYKLLRGYRGQKQDMFILDFEGEDIDIKLERKELADYMWADLDQVMELLAPVRKNIGKIALEKLAKLG